MSKVNPLHKAIFDGDCDVIDALMVGRDVNMLTQGVDKWNLLHMALLGVIGPANPDVVRHLIKLGVDVNAKDRRRWTPLHFAVRNKKNSAAVIKCLSMQGRMSTPRTTKGSLRCIEALFNILGTLRLSKCYSQQVPEKLTYSLSC